jgi:hypothetical protein
LALYLQGNISQLRKQLKGMKRDEKDVKIEWLEMFVIGSGVELWNNLGLAWFVIIEIWSDLVVNG